MSRALEEFVVEGEGCKTNIGFHRKLLAHDDFKSGNVDTGFCERFGQEQEAKKREAERLAAKAADDVGEASSVSEA